MELNLMSRGELSVLMRRIICKLSIRPEGSIELRNAHANLEYIRWRWQPGARP